MQNFLHSITTVNINQFNMEVQILNIRRLTPFPQTIRVGDNVVKLTFRAKSEQNSWAAQILFVVDTENPEVSVLVNGEPSKTLIFKIDVTEELKSYEIDVVLRVTNSPLRPTPFGIVVWRKNPYGVSYSPSTMTYM